MSTEIRFKTDLSADILSPEDHSLLPDYIRENPSPGHWVHLWGTDAAGNPVDYWASVEDEEGREALGRRVCSAANARVP
jgi:hypothetical protein